MSEYVLQLGDMMRVRMLFYRHVGVYVGNNQVVHNDKGGGVVISTLEQFSGGAPIELHKPAVGNYLDRVEVTRRALSLIGRKYDLLRFNCEHAAYYAHSGKAESPQLQVALGVGLILFCVAWLASES